MSSLGFESGLALAPRHGGGPAGPQAPAPSNLDVITFGDSRFAFGGLNTVDTANGYTQNDTALSVGTMLASLSGHRLRLASFPNFAIAGNTTGQMVASPRLNASNAATLGRWWRPADETGNAGASGNKGVADAAAHAAGIMLILAGTNDGLGIPATSQANITTMLNGLGAKTVVLLNEMPRGVDKSGAQNGPVTNGADRKALSDWINTLDFASGHANARANVIVVDVWGLVVNPASGPNWQNLPGYYFDGVHPSQWGARQIAARIWQRLQAVWPNWAALPQRLPVPLADGLVTPGAQQPFVNSNPVLTPGSAGGVSGTWGSAPLAANVAQGWELVGESNVASITCIADKSEVGPSGEPVQRLVLGGTLGAGLTASILLRQRFATNAAIAAEIAAGRLALTDVLRAVGRMRVEPGSQLLYQVALQWFVTSSNTAAAIRGFVGNGNQNDLAAAFGVDAYDDGAWRDVQAMPSRLDEPNMAANALTGANATSLVVQWGIRFLNTSAAALPVAATIRLARTGLVRVAN